MSGREKLRNLIRGRNDPRLAMFVICCHVDKPLEEKMPESVYNIPIQAGAALTDVRVCELDDFDGSPDNISDRNQRYSEMTAMYWIGKNTITDYVGISHYRRRFLLDDAQLAAYLDEGFDIITTKPYPLPEKICDNYPKSYYGSDWQLFLEILQRRNPDYYELSFGEFDKDHIHPCNMNIFKASVYEEYCDFVFPILNEFYERSPWKYDTYQRRDVGFIGERLSDLFVAKKQQEGYQVMEAPFSDLRSKGWVPEEECDLSDFQAVYAACQKYYGEHNVTRCRNLVAGALDRGGIEDDRIRTLALLFQTALREQKVLPKTMYEYLPYQWGGNLDILLEAFKGLQNMLALQKAGASAEVEDMYRRFIASTGFSEVAIDHVKSLL